MSKTHKAFWFTLIPAVILWNTLRPWLLHQIFGGEPGMLATSPVLLRWAVTNIALTCGLGALAGYAAAVLASPRDLRAATNVAIGVVVAFGLQNLIGYTGVGLPAPYFGILPLSAAGATIVGGAAHLLQRRIGRRT